MDLDLQLGALRKEQKRIKQVSRLISRFYDTAAKKKLNERNFRKQLVKLGVLIDVDSADMPTAEDAVEYSKQSRDLAKPIGDLKKQLKDLLQEFNGVRQFRTEFMNDGNVISVFDSDLMRTGQLAPDLLTTDLIIVKTCYFKILHDLIFDGFTIDGEKYVCYTASAGQIRTKRTVFILESLLLKCANTLMCGLTADLINAKGGVNVNKFLAYLALTNSATDEWADFDIDRCIVVDDMETLVHGTVDYIDEKTYDITRQEMDIPIVHTDGCGMILPSLSKKNFMVRLPWVKGLLGVFPFDKFVREANRKTPSINHGIVKDIYGKEYDILSDNIQIIFTKSQFKMWKYYDTWQSYKDLFKKHHCHAGICNMEPDKFDKAKINYQMLQTLTDLSDDELLHISRLTIEKLHKISHDRETMLSAFGATDKNNRINHFQECLKIYPELLQDEYCRDTLRQIKRSIEEEAIAGRLDVNGVYSFLLPDLYAFCQMLILGDNNPCGLLRDGEVYCRLFDSNKELDCLRSPHLYKEHAVRRNMYGINEEANRWFVTDGIYTSSHDLISKLLQFDNDGDKALIIDDGIYIGAVKRNMDGIVPLYYEMKKAHAQQITPEHIYNSLVAAYTGGSIGPTSNGITKIWNSDRDINLDAVKYLCLEGNFQIDYAKTLYMVTRPDYIDPIIKQYTQSKVPYFFIEAKGKSEIQVAEINDSCVNRLRRVIPKSRLNFSDRQLGKFDWRMLTSTDIIPSNEISKQIVETYKSKSSNMRFRFNDENDCTNAHYLCQQLKNDLLDIYNDENYVVDVLVKHLFYIRNTKNKTVFWECFGGAVLNNLRRNVEQDLSMCAHCGKRYRKTNSQRYLCSSCSKKQRNISNRTAQRKFRSKRT